MQRAKPRASAGKLGAADHRKQVAAVKEAITLDTILGRLCESDEPLMAEWATRLRDGDAAERNEMNTQGTAAVT